MSEFTESIVLTVLSGLVIPPLAAFLKQHIGLVVSYLWSVIRLFLFFSALAALLALNSSSFDNSELTALSLLFVPLVTFEIFAHMRFKNEQSINFLVIRILFTISCVFGFLYATAESFDQTEWVTLAQIFVLVSLFELIRPNARNEFDQNLRFEVNGNLSKTKLKTLFASKGLDQKDVQRVLARTFIHICVYLNDELVGFANLMWMKSAPGELDYLLVNSNVESVGKCMEILESESTKAGIKEIQITNKVLKMNPDLESKLPTGYKSQRCLVKELALPAYQKQRPTARLGKAICSD